MRKTKQDLIDEIEEATVREANLRKIIRTNSQKVKGYDRLCKQLLEGRDLCEKAFKALDECNDFTHAQRSGAEKVVGKMVERVFFTMYVYDGDIPF